ncbi:MAG TPA: FlxA-like family protein [Bryobacteraceae bacterium]|jgi:predicted  nucleic acid-binding Zn-ribbon protein|nr:FlxA-like family protein [Bryobacteraceae bacterium]
MGDVVEDYKKSLLPHVDKWAKNHASLGKQIDDLTKQIDELEKNKSRTPDQEKKLKDLKADLKAQGAKILLLTQNLNLDLLKVPPPAFDLKTPLPKQTVDNFNKVPAWLSTIVKNKGIPLGDNVVIAPDNISVDLKKMKIKSGGFKVIVKF